MIISPSILSADFLNLEKEITQFNSSNNIWFHLDVMDSHFVPNLTFGKSILKNLHKITDHPLDAHLMVTNPKFFIENFKDIGIYNLTFHLEASSNPMELIKTAKNYYKSVGISIKPGTPISSLNEEVLQNIDLILIMSVEPGFGGQSFMPNILEKAKELIKLKKQNGYHYNLQIDGGINELTAPLAIEAGITNLVAGSFVFNSNNPNKQIDKLRN